MSNHEECIDEDEDEAERIKRIEKLLRAISKRCDNANIKYEIDREDEDIGLGPTLTVSIPSGKKKREIDLWEVKQLNDFKQIEFEKYVIIGTYAAICCYETNTIEAAFTIIEDRFPSSSPFIRRAALKALGVSFNDKGAIEDTELGGDNPSHKTKIYVSSISDELRALTQPPTSLDMGITIKVRKLSTHEEAIEILDKITHAIFFSVEVNNGIALTLLRRRHHRDHFDLKFENGGIGYPHYEYDSEPISLYWYARSAINMPLLQFLAYYQVIEFYFPVYFKAEINRKVRAILKDPAFKLESDSDVSRITSSVSSKSNGYGNEKDQLKATLYECVEKNDIQEFIEGNESVGTFFSSKQKGITRHPINLNNKNLDLIDQVANRIYDIRCKVVHVKTGDGEVELLLPYTEESEKLFYDISLVQLLAKKVLIYSSTPLKT